MKLNLGVSLKLFLKETGRWFAGIFLEDSMLSFVW